MPSFLQGKYKRFIAPEHRPLLENWYNNYTTRQQRSEFKFIVRCVQMVQNAPEPIETTEEGLIKARAILQYGGQYISHEYKKLTAVWLARASGPDKQCFRQTFGTVRPLSLFSSKSDYKNTFTDAALDRTAERLHSINKGKCKRRIHEIKLALLRGKDVPTSEVSSGMPSKVAVSGVGSAALASTCPGGGSVGKRYVPKPIRRSPAQPRGTTYEAFFNAKPPDIMRLAVGARTRRASTRHGPPWGNIEDGFVQGAFVSATAAQFQAPGTTNAFKNYNDNYAVKLAAEYDREHQRHGSDDAAVPAAAAPDAASAVPAAAARRAPSSAPGARLSCATQVNAAAARPQTAIRKPGGRALPPRPSSAAMVSA